MQDATLGVYPSVSLYMDEVPLPFPIMTSNTGFDLERVEVLKGPQGILFGQNSTGGAINFIAKKPTDEFEMGTNLTYGRFNTFLGDAYVSGPLTETLRARAAIRLQDGDNWQESSSHGDKTGGPDTFAGRVLLDWQPSDDLSVLLNLNAWSDKSTPQELQFVAWRPQNPFPSPAENSPTADKDNLDTDFSRETNHFRDNSFEQAALRVDYTFGNDITLTSITSYIDFERREAFDLDGLAYRALDVTLTKGDVTSFSQELRIANNSDQAFRWLLGANYSSDKADEDTAIIYPDATIAVGTGGLLDRGGSLSNQDMENYAIFTSLELDIADDLTIKGGIRYTEADREVEACTYDIENHVAGFFGFLLGVPIPEGACATFNESLIPVLHQDEINEENTSWQIGLDWKPNADSLYYINIAKGYKAGSFPALAAATTAQYVPATQESLLDYEAGAKLNLLDGMLAANFAVFYYDYKDKQLRTTLDDFVFGFLDVLGNIPESSVRRI
ncbi:MAG: TonB-dependent receptor [Porticoccaceae bacterium]